MKVAILGSNVEALLAAYTAKLFNCNVKIFTTNDTFPKLNRASNFTPEPLNSFIPGNLCDKPDVIYLFKTEPENIVKKALLAEFVFTDLPYFSTDNPHFLGWNLSHITSRLFTETFGDVVLCNVMNEALVEDIRNSGSDIIISTVPLSEICKNPAHSFPLLTTVGSFKDWGYEIDSGLEDSFICWNGGNPSWFRVSHTFGRVFTEFPSTIKPPYISKEELFPVEYPNNTTCNCNPDILRIGNWGNWSSDYCDRSLLKIYNKIRQAIQTFNGGLN